VSGGFDQVNHREGKIKLESKINNSIQLFINQSTGVGAKPKAADAIARAR